MTLGQRVHVDELRRPPLRAAPARRRGAAPPAPRQPAGRPASSGIAAQGRSGVDEPRVADEHDLARRAPCGAPRRSTPATRRRSVRRSTSARRRRVAARSGRAGRPRRGSASVVQLLHEGREEVLVVAADADASPGRCPGARRRAAAARVPRPPATACRADDVGGVGAAAADVAELRTPSSSATQRGVVAVGPEAALGEVGRRDERRGGERVAERDVRLISGPVAADGRLGVAEPGSRRRGRSTPAPEHPASARATESEREAARGGAQPASRPRGLAGRQVP